MRHREIFAPPHSGRFAIPSQFDDEIGLARRGELSATAHVRARFSARGCYASMSGPEEWDSWEAEVEVRGPIVYVSPRGWDRAIEPGSNHYERLRLLLEEHGEFDERLRGEFGPDNWDNWA